MKATWKPITELKNESNKTQSKKIMAPKLQKSMPRTLLSDHQDLSGIAHLQWVAVLETQCYSKNAISSDKS